MSNDVKFFETSCRMCERKINLEGLKYFILGDFNINLLSNAPPIIQYKESLELLGVINLVNCSTRYMNMQILSLLDHVFSNNCSKIIFSSSISYYISDNNTGQQKKKLSWCL